MVVKTDCIFVQFSQTLKMFEKTLDFSRKIAKIEVCLALKRKEC
jgi:hypothetical protein